MTDTVVEKECFVISPIGDEGSEIRQMADQVLEHAIKPAMTQQGYRVIRADQISRPGMITVDVLRHVTEADIVIAVLSGRNPNVFYELAIRHASGKPYIQMIDRRETIPFDVAEIRTIQYDTENWSGSLACVSQIIAFVQAIESGTQNFDNPVFETLAIRNSLRSGETKEIDNATIFQEIVRLREATTGEINDLRREVRASKPGFLSKLGEAVGTGFTLTSSLPLSPAASPGVSHTHIIAGSIGPTRAVATPPIVSASTQTAVAAAIDTASAKAKKGV